MIFIILISYLSRRIFIAMVCMVAILVMVSMSGILVLQKEIAQVSVGPLIYIQARFNTLVLGVQLKVTHN